MANIDNTKKAEFIIAHGKDICYNCRAPLEKLEPELYAELIS